MKFLDAFFANAADVGPDGRCFVLGGGIEGIIVNSIPTVIPAVALFLRIRFDRQECGQTHTLRLDLSCPDGSNREAVVEAQLAPNADHRSLREGATTQVAMSVYGIPVNKSGEFSFNLPDSTGLQVGGF